MKLRLFLVALTCWPAWLAAQPRDTNSLLLTPERLTENDIAARDFRRRDVKVVSATRTLESPEDLPFSMWVITSEDILRYGFVTLADVLKAAPGIRVSQPGNAVEGETFLMRGVSGNQYVKVLINDIPVKSLMSLGMPIGAQLPIRQAERIEVLYGAAGVVYGNEACAGVVNIILRETERPIFTQADLSAGQSGYNNLDLTFGGKLLRDRNILRFSIYGSSTVRSSTDVLWDDDLYNLSNYLPLGFDSSLYRNNRNFEPRSTDQSQYAKLSSIGHESRMMGLSVKWRGLNFSYQRMSRRDASYLGLNPLARSYTRSGDRLDEETQSYVAGFRKRWGRFSTYNTLSVLRYNVSTNSTSSFIYDYLSAGSFVAQGGPTLDPIGQLGAIRRTDSLLTDRIRFAYANGTDVRLESHGTLRLSRRLQLESGLQATLTTGTPLITRYDQQPQTGLLGVFKDEDILPFDPPTYGDYDSQVFGNLDWRDKHLRVIAGLGFNLAVAEPLPRLGVLYRIDSTWAVFSNYSTGLKHLHNYQRANTYLLNDYLVSSSNFFFNTERFRNLELGVRQNNGTTYSELLAFYQEAYNLLRDGYLNPYQITAYQLGFADPGTADDFNTLALANWGVQLRLAAENTNWVTTDRRRNRREQRVLWRGEFFAQYTDGREWLGHGLASTNEVRNQPRWTTQFRSSWRSGRFQMTLASTRHTSVLSKAVSYREQWQRTSIRERYPTFRTWDLMGRFYLSKNFVLYVQTNNLFNRKAYGLDATGSPDDLLAPIQPGRRWRFGVNYSMN